MKKIGSFFFTFIPFLLALVFQYLAMFFVMGVTLFYEHIRYIFSSNRIYADLWNKTLDLWSTTRVNTLIMIVFSLLCIGAFGFWYHAGYNGIYLIHPRKVFHPLSIVGIILLVPGTQCLSTYLVSFTASLFPQWMKAYEKLMESTGINSGLTVSMFFLFHPACPDRRRASLSRCHDASGKKSVPILGSKHHAGAFIWTFSYEYDPGNLCLFPRHGLRLHL